MFRTLLLLACVAVTHLSASSSLTVEVARNATAYMEWLLDVKFSDGDRDRYQQILAGTWRSGNQGAIQGLTSMAQVYDKLSTMREQERAALREKSQEAFVKLLRNGSDEDTRWLLGLYESAHKDQSGTSIVGRWSNGRISTIQYRDVYTGVSAPTNGNSFAYEFHADGTYSFTGLMQSVMYNCTTSMFSNESGTYILDGGSVSLRPERNPYKMMNTCAPSSNREGPGKLVSRSYRFRITQDSAGPKLELVGADGSAQTLIRSR